MKIFVSIGLGPGLAAIALDHLRGNRGPINARWWMHFATIFLIVAAIDVSSLLTGDARTAEEFAVAHVPGLSAIGIVGSIVAAAICAFIFASAAASRTPSLNAITRWRAPLRWWLIALFLPAALLVISFAIAKLTGDELPPPVSGGLPAARFALFAIRAALFTFFAVAIGEETGWRGFMLPELRKRFSPLNASLILGVIWGFWHFPLFLIQLYPGEPDSIIEYLFTGPLIALLFTWLYNRTRGNLLLVMAMNNSGRVLPTTTLFPILLTALIVVVVITEKMWRRDSAAVPPHPTPAQYNLGA